MITSYPTTAVAVNPVRLSSDLRSFLRWIVKLSRETGFCWASNRYLAAKQGCSVDTITRRVQRLEAAGLVTVEQIPGVERRITPIVAAPRAYSPPHSEPAAIADTPAEGLSSLRTYTGKQQQTQATTDAVPPAPGGVVADLVQEGVSARVAARLVRQHGEEAAREQLAALPHRKARDRAAVLVQALREGWAIPAGLRQERDRLRQEQERAAKRAAQAVLAREESRRREDALQRLSRLPEGQKKALESRAREMLLREKPAAARLILGTRAGEHWLRGRMLALLDEGTT